MSNESNRGLTSAIGSYIFIAVVVAIIVAVTAQDYLEMSEVSFWRRILLFILSVPACTIGLFLGRVIRDAIAPDFVVAGSTGGLIKARLFWAFGPQAIGLAIGLALAGYVIKLLPAPTVPIDETKIIGVYQGQNDLAVIWRDSDGNGYCIKLDSNIACSDEGPDKSNTLEFESDINGKNVKDEMELEFEENGRAISFTVDDYGTYSWTKPIRNFTGSSHYQQGLFCGEKDSKSISSQICITDHNSAQKEVWFSGRCAFSVCPPMGTPIMYDFERYEVFDPDTMSFFNENILISFQQTPPRDSIYPTMNVIPSPAPTYEVLPGLPEMPGVGTPQQPTENGGILPYDPTGTRGNYQGSKGLSYGEDPNSPMNKQTDVNIQPPATQSQAAPTPLNTVQSDKYTDTAKQTPMADLSNVDVTGLYRNLNSQVYIYRDGEFYFSRIRTWDNPEMIEALPPDSDVTRYLLPQNEDTFGMTESYDTDPIQSELYRLVVENGIPRFISLASTQSENESDRTTYVKVTDLYGEAGIEGPKFGIFCGTEAGSDYSFVCIRPAPINEEVWLIDGVGDNYPEIGTPVEYSIQKYNVFEPETLTMRVDEVVIGLVSKK